MQEFSVHEAPVTLFIRTLKELRRLGEMSRRIGEAPSSVVIAMRQSGSGWLEFPENSLDRSILLHAINERIRFLVELVKKHDNIDLLSSSLMMSHK